MGQRLSLRPRPAYRLLLALGALIAASSLVCALAVAASVHQIAQKGREFQVKTINIGIGDVVRFTNDDEFLHQIFVTSDAFKFDSAEQPPGEAIEVKFPSAGLYSVRCHIHPKMLLSIMVK
ncbi:MAG: methylamine utilization protein [Proteobacteria bacterium]|nr:methylamine utilization protein [Pseudomonadota bacterium]